MARRLIGCFALKLGWSQRVNTLLTGRGLPEESSFPCSSVFRRADGGGVSVACRRLWLHEHGSLW